MMIECSTYLVLKSEVQRRLDEGWELQGGVSICSLPGNERLYAQAIFFVEGKK